MTSKELLYLEDALGHEKYFQSKCKETASQLQDIELKTCIEQMAQKHQQIFQQFLWLTVREGTSMGDKNLMENILLLEKGVCDLFLHGTIESSTSSVHQAFSTALHDSLGMQDTIYDMMAEKGWYPAEQAEQKKIDSVLNKR